MTSPLHLFDAYGVELEYMLVDRDSLNVVPAVDEIFKAASGTYASDYEDGPITWSNELVRHVMEVKVTTPVPTFAGLPETFMTSIQSINNLAHARSARLMPTAMHPWMDPAHETQLWPHEYASVYQTFHRIFDCYRHGWANLQSVHLNLPFNGDDEFARLHAAIRLVLPLIPALAASSPIVEGKVTGIMDNRLDVYCRNSRLISQITGEVIPEPVYSYTAYDETIFQPMYKAIAPYDVDGTLQDEFLNARGAIARFERSAIEIRLIDVQECPQADVAIVEAVVHAVKQLVSERYCDWKSQSVWPAAHLRGILLETIVQAEKTPLHDMDYLAVWGINKPATALEVWQHITKNMTPESNRTGTALEKLFSRGPLARRMISHLGNGTSREEIRALYVQLAECLQAGRMLD